VRSHDRAPALEAYLVDPAGKRIDMAFAYVGLLPMFEAAGFHQVVETSARSAGLPRWLVRQWLIKKPSFWLGSFTSGV